MSGFGLYHETLLSLRCELITNDLSSLAVAEKPHATYKIIT